MRTKALVIGLLWILGTPMAAAVPAAPAPVAITGPPPAWIETSGGDHWLATRFEKWCPPSGLLCALEPVAALSSGGRCGVQVFGYVPEVRVRPGELTRIHLATAPRSASVSLSGTAPDPAAASERIDWIVPAGAYAGPASFGVAFDGGTVRYLARVVVTADRSAPRVRGLRPLRTGGRLALRTRLSEPTLVTGCIEPVGRHQTSQATLYRRLPRAWLGRGTSVIALGVLPRGRYKVRLLLRDRSGNSAVVVATVGRSGGTT